MTARSELPPLIAGIALALAGVGLAAAHIAVPDYVTNGSVLLIGAAAGALVPGRLSSSTSPSSPPASSSTSSSSPEPPLWAVQDASVHATNAGRAAATAEKFAGEVSGVAAELRALLASSGGLLYPKPQVAPPTSTPTPGPIAAPGQAEPRAGGAS